METKDKSCKNCKHFRNYDGGNYCKHYPDKLEQIPRIQLDAACPFWEVEHEPTQYSRIETDLDSIEVSADPRRKIKIYFNTRIDTQAEVEKRIVDAVQYVETAIGLLKTKYDPSDLEKLNKRVKELEEEVREKRSENDA